MLLVMENLPKPNKGGRPRKIPEAGFGRKFHHMPKEVRGLVGFDVPTERTAANRYYADKARGILPGLSKSLQFPDDPVLAAKIRVGIDWIMGRTTVLSELGRMLVEDPSENEVARFQDSVKHIGKMHPKLTAKQAAAYVRRMRLGVTPRRDRLQALHHDVNAAINLHRQRFPESTWADIRKALQMSAKQVEHK